MTLERMVIVGAIGAGMLCNLHPKPLSGQGSGPVVAREIHLGMEVRIMAHGPESAVRSATGAAFDRIAELEDVFSDWRSGSELSHLGQGAVGKWQPVSDPLWQVLVLALEVAAATDGRFDPTIGPLTRLWRDARARGEPPSETAAAAARQLVDWRAVELDSARHAVRLARAGMGFDLGAVAKGWILDAALREMARHGVESALIEAGGDIVMGESPPGRIGWRIIARRGTTDTILELSNAAVASSGSEFQFIVGPDGVRRSHVLDATTGEGLTDGSTITVVARSAALADALATAISLVQPVERPALAVRFGVDWLH